MEKLIINIDTTNDAKHLANFLKTLSYVKSVIIQKSKDKKDTIKQINPQDWSKPASRKATDEEILQMLDECEKGEPIPENEAREKTIEYLRKWEAKRTK